MAGSSQTGLELSASCEVRGDVAVLRYRVINRANAPLFLFNVLHGGVGEDRIFQIEERSYVEIEADALVLSRKIMPVPDDTFVETKNVPLVTRLEPGEQFTNTVNEALPLRPRGPYDDEPESGGTERVMPAYFEIGYFFGKPGTDELALTLPTSDGPKMGFDPFPESSQKIARVGPIAELPVVV